MHMGFLLLNKLPPPVTGGDLSGGIGKSITPPHLGAPGRGHSWCLSPCEVITRSIPKAMAVQR